MHLTSSSSSINPTLEDYRRLTPRLRSPAERALSMGQLAWMGSHFRACSHCEFILFSILPVLAATLGGRRRAWAGWQQAMQRLDRALLTALPAVGRTCWETVIVGRPIREIRVIRGKKHDPGCRRLLPADPFVLQ